MDLHNMFVTSDSSIEDIKNNILSLTSKQREHYDTIINSVLSNNGEPINKLFFWMPLPEVAKHF